MAVSAACLVTMRPLIKRFVPALVASAVSRMTSRVMGTAGGKTKPVSGRSGGGAGGVVSASKGNEVHLAGYPTHKGGRNSHIVSTRISGRHDPYETLVEDEKEGQIRITQEGPVFTVESRGGRDGSDTDVEAARGPDSPEHGSLNASTRELFVKEP